MFEWDVAYPYALLVIGIIIALYFITREPSFKVEPEPPKTTKDMTLEQLKYYDGQKNREVFMAAKGVIYDVTNTTFYRKDGPYGVFAGHDASVNLSKMSHDENLLNKWGQYTFNEDQMQILNDWVKRFEEKYRRVGVVIQNS